MPPRSPGAKWGDFRNFLYAVWDYLGLQAGGIPGPTPLQYDIARYLQHGPKRRIICGFRGVAKSWITVAYVLWRLYRSPQQKIIVVSASKALADNFSTFCFQLIRGMPLLAHLAPADSQRNSKIQFDVGPATESKDPSVRSVGITGMITGSRADLIVADDIETPGNSLTQGGRDKLLELVREFDAVLKPGGEIVYLGTPQSEASIYNALVSRGYGMRKWPVRVPSEEQKLRYGYHLSPYYDKADIGPPGATVEPLRFSTEDLMERELSYGRSGFDLQFMLDTSLADRERYPLKLSELIVHSVAPDVAPQNLVWASTPALAWDDAVPQIGFPGDRYYRPLAVIEPYAPYTGTVLAIDPKGRGADELGYCIVSTLNGLLYVPCAGGLPGGYDEATLTRLALLARDYKATHVIYESNFGDGMFGALFQPILLKHAQVTLKEVRNLTQKELRIIDTLEPVLNRHKLIIDPKVIQEDYESAKSYPVDKQARRMLFYQMSRITRQKASLAHDDRLDVLAMGVRFWLDRLSLDADVETQAHNKHLRDAELARFLKHAMGAPSPQPRWADPRHPHRPALRPNPLSTGSP